jgi:valyl-tRNA synthetase
MAQADTISKNYSPQEFEDKWYQFWLDKGYFNSTPDEREPYTIVIPPPNVTGVLHMGHMLNNTIQDVLVRKARMAGKNACWVPGTDHASIATEAKVVKMLADQGIAKSDLSREEFLNHAMEWKDKYGGIILEQLKKLGASCDWNRTKFTMEPSLYNAVIEVFIDLYEKGLIYRGTRMVNWDPAGQTTLSDEEVIFAEKHDKLYYVKYKIEGTEDFITVATARPETIAGDVAICVHPEDEKYKHLVGKNIIVPLINRVVPVITDDYIDIEFGTGALKVTPAHDINDYNIGLKHNLPVIDTLNADGTIAEAGELFVGKDRFEARKLWKNELEAQGLLLKVEDYTHNIGTSERTGAVVEPKISTQWFMDMKKFMDKNPEVLSSVMDDEIRFVPTKYKNTYAHWIENIKDWNISRQLWWGHQIPAWYAADGTFEVAKTAEEAATKFNAKGNDIKANDLKQDPDVLDTWFSSWLWPISVFDGIENPDNEDINYYYPTNDLVTAPEILFFWVARMVMAGYEYKKQLPFKTVYYTGIVRDKQRRKMSKSLGNSPDPLDLIAEHGADSVRMGMLLCSPAGNDILFDISQVEQGRNFANKIWNAYKLTQIWEQNSKPETEAATQAHTWFQNRLDLTLAEIDKNFNDYRLNDALMAIYKLIWNDFCAIYLEAVKPNWGDTLSSDTYTHVCNYFNQLMRVLHPFMPFISEEIFQLLGNHSAESCCIAPYPTASQNSLGDDTALNLVTDVRAIRSAQGVSPKDVLKVVVETDQKEMWNALEAMICKLANIELSYASKPSEAHKQILVGRDTCFVLMADTMDVNAEIAKIEAELKHQRGFLISVEKKLSNEKFVANAQEEVVNREKQKLADAVSKIESLEKAIKALK